MHVEFHTKSYEIVAYQVGERVLAFPVDVNTRIGPEDYIVLPPRGSYQVFIDGAFHTPGFVYEVIVREERPQFTRDYFHFVEGYFSEGFKPGDKWYTPVRVDIVTATVKGQ